MLLSNLSNILFWMSLAMSLMSLWISAAIADPTLFRDESLSLFKQREQALAQGRRAGDKSSIKSTLKSGVGPGKAIARHPSSIPTENLSLERAIAKVLQNNFSVEARRLSFRSSEISYLDARDQMFLPSINLVASSSSKLGVGRLPSTNPPTESYGFPTTSVALELGSYTLFNFWRDWNNYEQARLEWVRTQEQYNEFIRALKQQTIVAYFKYGTELEKLDSVERSVATATAVVDVLRTRVGLNTAQAGDLSSSEVDLLNSQNNLYAARQNVLGSLWSLNQLLGDPIGASYQITDKIKFVTIKITPGEALKTYLASSPTIKDRIKDIKRNELALDLAHKNRIPLPKVTLSGLSVAYAANYYAPGTTVTSGGGPNIEVSTSISVSLPLVGPGGLFNSRVLESSEMNLEQANIAYRVSFYSDNVAIHQLIEQIKQSEATIENNKKAFDQSASLLENLTEKLLSENVNRLELRDVVNQARNADITLQDSIVDHLQKKLSLANMIGVDHLPGDIY